MVDVVRDITQAEFVVGVPPATFSDKRLGRVAGGALVYKTIRACRSTWGIRRPVTELVLPKT